MPDIRVLDEQGTTHVFPDGSTPEMIAKAMNVKPPSSELQAPNAVAQAQQQTRQAIPTMAASDAASFPGARKGLSPFTQQGQRQAQTGENYNEYQRQSGQTIGTTAAGMATGGMFPAIQGAGLAKNILPFLGRTATSAGSMGAGATIGGATPQEAKGAAIGGALGQPISEGLSAGLPWLAKSLKNTAVTQFGKALAPTTRQNKAITQDIAPEMIRRGVRGSLEGMEQRAGQEISNINPQLNSEYGRLQGAGKLAGSGDQVIADLENLKQSYMPEGNVAQPEAVSAIEGVQKIVKQYGPDISPNSLRRLRQIFEEVPAQRGAYAGADLSTNYTLNAQQHAADSIRGILNKSPSDIGALNKEISFWLDVQRVTSQSALRRTGQEGGLLKTLWPLGAAVAGGGAGFAAHGAEAGLGAAATTMLATQVAKAARSPAWRTVSAVTKDRLANALARGDSAATLALLSKVGLSTSIATPQPAPSGLPWQRQSQSGQPQQ